MIKKSLILFIERAERVPTNMESRTFFQCEECWDFVNSKAVIQNHADGRAPLDHQSPLAQEQSLYVREPSKDQKDNKYDNYWTRNANLLIDLT